MELSNNLAQPLASVGTMAGPAGFIPRTFPVQRQLLSNWCWAASTLGISLYYHKPPPFTQQQFVAQALNQPICGMAAPNPYCNQTFDFGQALKTVGHLKTPAIPNPLLPNDLYNALQQAPVGCQMILPTLGGHAVVVVDGYYDGGGQLIVRVADPMDGTIVVMPFDQFRNNFRKTGGYWARTYLTS